MKKIINGEEQFSPPVNPIDAMKERIGVPSGVAIQVPVQNTSKSNYPIEKSKYEVKKESFFTIEFGLIESDGRFLIVDKENYGSFPDIEKHWVKFRYWRYDEELKWRESSTKFDPDSRNFTIDRGKFDELKIRNLMIDWSFAELSDRHKLFHVNGFLVDESFEMFKSLFPNIILAIINSMNNILENNQ